MGYPGALEITTKSKFGPVTGNFSSSEVNCTGTEKKLDECEQKIEVTNCGPDDAAGLVCNPKLGNFSQ